MAPKIFPVLLAVFSILMVATIKPTSAIAGGFQAIKNVSDPYVVEIAKFAVDQFNREKHTEILLLNVTGGESQVVAGTKYKLQIQVKPPSFEPQTVQAVVWDKPWMKFRKLISFDIV